MANVTINVATQPQQFALGAVGGLFRFRLQPVTGALPIILESSVASVTFENVPPADYDTSAWRTDANTGEVLGTPVSGRRILATELVSMVDVPVSIVVTVG